MIKKKQMNIEPTRKMKELTPDAKNNYKKMKNYTMTRIDVVADVDDIVFTSNPPWCNTSTFYLLCLILVIV